MPARYYWIKIFREFFANKTIKKIRKMPGGDTYIIIYMRMQLLALCQPDIAHVDGTTVINGWIMYEGVEDTIEQEIALELDEEVSAVKAAFRLFVKLGWIEIVNADAFFPAIPAGSEGESAQRMRAKRIRDKRASQCDGETSQCDGDVTQYRTEIKKINIDNNIKDKMLIPDIYIDAVHRLATGQPQK